MLPHPQPAAQPLQPPPPLLADDTTPFLVSTMPLTNPFAYNPHDGAFQPVDDSSRMGLRPSWSHDLSGIHHSSSEGAFTRVLLPSSLASSLYLSQTSPIFPTRHDSSSVRPLLLRSASEQVSAPVYQDHQVCVGGAGLLRGAQYVCVTTVSWLCVC